MTDTTSDPVVSNTPEMTAPKKFDRDAIRTAILDAKSTDEIVDVFGVQIEIRAPDLEGLLQYRDAQTDDNVMARSLVNTCFVPGTDEQVFDDADVAVLMKQKFSKDMRKLVKAINGVLAGDEEVQTQVVEQTFRTT